MGRVLLGGFVGGMVIFMWGAVAHMALPIGEMGLRQLPEETALIEPMRSTITESGLYFFPGMDRSHTPSESELAAWEAKIKEGPSGLLLVHPRGGEAMSPRQLGTEFATDVVAALLAGFLLTYVRAGYAGRVAFVMLLGVFGFVTISVPYWNWYGFPFDFTAAEGIDQLVGWTLAGLVLAAIVRPASAPAAAPDVA